MNSYMVYYIISVTLLKVWYEKEKIQSIPQFMMEQRLKGALR
jgi:hypothetical protein